MELYHGSPIIVEHPVFGAGNPNNDYGLGFYCTESIELAKEWACRTPDDGFANKYFLDTDGLDVLDLSSDKWHILNWLAILLENRIFDISNPLAKEAKQYIRNNFLPPYVERDVIIGYRADDSYFSFAKAFLNNAISLGALSEAMHLGKLGQQICVKSEKAFDCLRFVGAVPADGQEYFIRRYSRDEEAREDYLRILSKQSDTKHDIYILDILRQEWNNDDERLR